MKQIIIIFLTIVSLGLNAQISVAPQIGLNYSNSQVNYWPDHIFSPEQKKIFPSIGFRLNYHYKRALFSADINLTKRNQFNLDGSLWEFAPPGFAKVNNTDINLSCSYNLIDKLFIGAGIKLWLYNKFETLRGKPSFSKYTNSYAMLNATYMIKNIIVELSMARYLSVIVGTDDNPPYEIIKAPEIFSLKVGYIISFNKRGSKG